MSDLLGIGRSGLRAYARSMETVSHNIANAENPDYVRRSTLLADATVSGKLNPLYSAQTGLNGVRIDSVSRSSRHRPKLTITLSLSGKGSPSSATRQLSSTKLPLFHKGIRNPPISSSAPEFARTAAVCMP